MKRFLPILIIVGSLGYFAHRYWDRVGPKVEPIVQPVISAVTGKLPEPTPPDRTSPQARHPVELPRTGRIAAPGFLYMLDRVSQTTDTGVVAVIPGEEVRIMQRKPNGRIRITTGKYDFDVKESQVTQDFDLAQAARVRAGIPPR